MNKVLLVGVIGLPLILFISVFGQMILVTFIENENDQIDAETGMMETLVGGDGWTDPNGWAVEK